MATITNIGQTLLATALQTPGAQAAIVFVDIAPGCGTLASGITASNPTTSLPLNAGLPAALGAGQALTITDGVNTDTCTVASGGAAQGATSIPVNSFTPAHTYAANTTAVAPTPTAFDLALYNGAAGIRVAANAGIPGANPGESLNNGYFDGTQPSNTYMTVGYWGGPTATSTPGTGTLIAEDVQYWAHTLNQDSASFLFDNTL